MIGTLLSDEFWKKAQPVLLSKVGDRGRSEVGNR